MSNGEDDPVIPAGGADEPAGAKIPHTINLRRRQADFLDRITKELGLDRSEVCRLIIDLALQTGDATASGVPDVQAAAASLPGGVGNQPRGYRSRATRAERKARSWTRRTIYLEPAQVEALTNLQKRNGDSISRSIRRIIVDFMEQSGEEIQQSDALPSQRPHSRRKGLYAFLAAAVVALAISFVASNPDLTDIFAARGPTIITAVPWAGRDAGILFDPHTHTQFSDGERTPESLVELARSAGCNALAITDHSATGGTASAAQFESLNALRQKYPLFLLFGGVEINMPSYGGREHVNLIVDPSVEEEILPSLRDAAEHSIAEAQTNSSETGSDLELLRLAARYHLRGTNFVMIYNHPSRKDPDAGENYSDILRWNADAPLLIGFEGGPGHQNLDQPGAYEEPIFTMDRWDPVVAEVGGTWDRLLSEGYQLWGAIASSDYHNHDLDKDPCEFSRTHIAAEALSYEAVLKALRAGTFWADHGQLLEQLSFSIELTGLLDPVFPGSVIALGNIDTTVLAQVSIIRGPGGIAAPLKVEFISNCQNGETELLAVEQLDAFSSNASIEFLPAASGADKKSCFIRARVRLENDAEPDLLAYTNHIRLNLP